MFDVELACRKAAGMAHIGGAPVCGVDWMWFKDQWDHMVSLYPQVADWSDGRKATAIQGLYILDPEDLV
jgi:hypothetical protein